MFRNSRLFLHWPNSSRREAIIVSELKFTVAIQIDLFLFLIFLHFIMKQAGYIKAWGHKKKKTPAPGGGGRGKQGLK
jgi:hypothetical protein